MRGRGSTRTRRRTWLMRRPGARPCSASWKTSRAVTTPGKRPRHRPLTGARSPGRRCSAAGSPRTMACRRAPEPLTGPEPGGEGRGRRGGRGEKKADAAAASTPPARHQRGQRRSHCPSRAGRGKNAAAQAKAEEIQSAQMPDEDPDLSPFAAWDRDAEMERDAILQPAPPEMPASPRVPEPEMLKQADSDHEAGS